MAANRAEISAWYDRGIESGAAFMVIVCDTFDYDDYPVYVKQGEDPRSLAREYDGKSMQNVMEVYDLSLSKDFQMNERRAHNYGKF